MARERYYVVFQDNKWKIKNNNRYLESYSTQKAAIKDAVRLAHEEGSKGHDAQVLVQGKDLLFKTEWTYGHDPYPPPG
jgi:Uncharacterized protein conserved in bacteria (DUF2188)